MSADPPNRFNKGYPKPLNWPLTKEPPFIEGATMVNPRAGDAHGIEPPIYPEDPRFQEQISDFLESAFLTLQNKPSTRLLKKYNPREGYDGCVPKFMHSLFDPERPQDHAHLVHMDNPLKFPIFVLDWVRANKFPLSNPRTKFVDFEEEIINTTIEMAQLMGKNWKIGIDTKNQFGRPRPEEVFGVAPHIITAYKEGSPRHSDFLEGHGVLAAVTQILRNKYLLPYWADCEIYDGTFQWGAARVYSSRVHWWDCIIPSFEAVGFFPPNKTDFNS